MAHVTYPPLDTLKPVTAGVWIVDSGPHRIARIPLPVRMTVLQLSSGQCLLHSPTRFTTQLKDQIEALGPIGHLVAPNSAHWSYMVEWQDHCPSATCWTVAALGKRRSVAASPLRIDRELEDGAPEDWQAEIEVIVVAGLGLQEAALFHKPSRTLVLTDLVVNVEPAKLPLLPSLGARLVGSTAPDGKAPVYVRMAMRAGGEKASEAGHRLIRLNPDRVIFAHGEWFASNGAEKLREALSWLLR